MKKRKAYELIRDNAGVHCTTLVTCAKCPISDYCTNDNRNTALAAEWLRTHPKKDKMHISLDPDKTYSIEFEYEEPTVFGDGTKYIPRKTIGIHVVEVDK